MKLGNCKNIVNCASVVIEGSVRGNSDIVHIDTDCCSKGFMFENDILVDVVHHGLEHRWQVGESKIHDCGFEKSISGFKHCFLLIPFLDSYVVIAPLDVKLCVYVCIAEILNEI